MKLWIDVNEVVPAKSGYYRTKWRPIKHIGAQEVECHYDKDTSTWEVHDSVGVFKCSDMVTHWKEIE